MHVDASIATLSMVLDSDDAVLLLCLHVCRQLMEELITTEETYIRDRERVVEVSHFLKE